MNKLTITHDHGFFSCCSVRLHEIINWFNTHCKLPDIVDSTQQFKWYKSIPADGRNDISCRFFKSNRNIIPYNGSINYCENDQYSRYETLDFYGLTPFIKKYFDPSREVCENILNLENKYNINYDSTVAVFYRGNDKVIETVIAGYDIFFNKCQEILKQNPNVTFFVQTDEKEFLDKFMEIFPNSFHLEELPKINKDINMVMHKVVNIEDRPRFGINFLSATLMVSKCRYIVTHTGNCGIWSVLFRGNATNVYQYNHTTNTIH